MASLIQRNRHYYAQFYDSTRHPKRKRLALGTKRKKIARRKLVELEEAYEGGAFDPWHDDPDTYDRAEVEPTSMAEALQAFLKEKERLGRSPNTLRSYRGIVGRLSRRVGEGTLLSRLRARDVERYIRDREVSRSTRRKRFRHLRAFFNWAVEERMLRRSPLEGAEAPEAPEKLPKAITRGELQAVCKAVRAAYKGKRAQGHCREGELIWRIPLFRFAFFTGMRASELGRLRWRDVDFERSLIVVRRQKSRKEQTIPLNRKAREIVEGLEREEPEHYVFTSPKGNRLRRNIRSFRENASAAFRRARRRAGIDRPLSFHSLRHGFCTALAEAGKSAVVIKEAARHADIATSMRYVHMANRKLKDEIDTVF